MNEFLLRDIKLSIEIKSGDRFNQLLCQIHQDPNYRASIALFAPLKISLREKEYLKEKLQDVVEDFAIETCVIHVVSLKTEQHRGQFEFLAQLEFSPDINHMLEAFDSVLADHKGIKEQKVQKLIPEIKNLS